MALAVGIVSLVAVFGSLLGVLFSLLCRKWLLVPLAAVAAALAVWGMVWGFGTYESDHRRDMGRYVEECVRSGGTVVPTRSYVYCVKEG